MELRWYSAELFSVIFYWNIDSNSWWLDFSDWMEVFNNFNNLGQHDDSFNNFLDVIGLWSELYWGCVGFDMFGFSRDLESFKFGLINNDFS